MAHKLVFWCQSSLAKFGLSNLTDATNADGVDKNRKIGTPNFKFGTKVSHNKSKLTDYNSSLKGTWYRVT